MKQKWSASRIVSVVIGVVASIMTMVALLLLLGSQGVLGWVCWEVLGLLAVIFLFVGQLACLVLGVLSLRFNKILLPTKIVGGTFLVLAVALTSFFGGCYDSCAGLNANLNFYYSSDSYIVNDTNIKVAVASDSHWGAAKSNAEARNAIMDSIHNGGYDLFVHGGDLVDLGFNRSYYEEAITDLEAHLQNQRSAFVMGNHDALINGEHNFRRIFQGGENSLNHVLNIAPKVHWVVFNMIWDYTEVTTADLNWLDTTLSRFDKDDCVIVQSHGFYYGTGGQSGMGGWYDVPDNINNICPIFEKHGVDLVVSGHIHSMELMEKNGVSYALVGPGGGSKFADTSVKTAANSYFHDGDNYGYTSYDIKDDGTINVSFLDQNGTNLFSKVVNYK